MQASPAIVGRIPRAWLRNHILLCCTAGGACMLLAHHSPGEWKIVIRYMMASSSGQISKEPPSQFVPSAPPVAFEPPPPPYSESDPRSGQHSVEQLQQGQTSEGDSLVFLFRGCGKLTMDGSPLSSMIFEMGRESNGAPNMKFILYSL